MNLKKFMKKIDVEQVVIGVLIIVLVVLVVVYVNKNNEGFEGTKPKLYFFYVDWCPHCTTAKETIFNDSVWKQLNTNNNVELIKVNCEGTDEETNLAKENNIKAYPTVIIDNNGQKKDVDVSKSSIQTLISTF
jgi:glutaredoxin